jgi:hypothetical protein
MLENTEGAIKMENPDKLETQGTQYEDKQIRRNKNISIFPLIPSINIQEMQLTSCRH